MCAVLGEEEQRCGGSGESTGAAWETRHHLRLDVLFPSPLVVRFIAARRPPSAVGGSDPG